MEILNSLSTAYLLLSALVGAVAGGVIVLIGVRGTEKDTKRRLFGLETDMEDIRERFKSFQKTMSGKLGSFEKQARVSVEEEAKRLLRESQDDSGTDEAWIHGQVN